MRPKTLALSLLIALLAPTPSGVASAKQAKVIKLVATDGGSTIATIYVNDRSLLFEFSNNQDSFYFGNEAVFTINNKEKTYSVQSYPHLQASVRQKAAEIVASPSSSGPPEGVELNLTQETETISGLRARKLIKKNRGNIEAEFWMSSELMPPRVRALGESIRSSLPVSYWRRLQGNPGMVELVMLFGVPLRISYGHDNYYALVADNPSLGISFQVPPGYRRVDN